MNMLSLNELYVILSEYYSTYSTYNIYMYISFTSIVIENKIGNKNVYLFIKICGIYKLEIFVNGRHVNVGKYQSVYDLVDEINMCIR